jgi:hypothetical protein
MWYHCIMWHQREVFEPVCSSSPLVTNELNRTTVSKPSMSLPMPRSRIDGPLPTSSTRPRPIASRLLPLLHVPSHMPPHAPPHAPLHAPPSDADGGPPAGPTEVLQAAAPLLHPTIDAAAAAEGRRLAGASEEWPS